MSYSYSLSNNNGKLRFAIGDVTDAGHVVTDEEITYLLSLYTTVAATTPYLWKHYIRVLATRADTSSGAESTTWSQVYANAQKRYEEYLNDYFFDNYADFV